MFMEFQVYNCLFNFTLSFLSFPPPSPDRVEKLEYKEIITPSWREVQGSSPTLTDSPVDEPTKDSQEKDDKSDVQPAVKETKGEEECQAESVNLPAEAPSTDHTPSPSSDEEDTSDAAYSHRHDKCEAIEKQKFLNFISGGSRKRTRPQSIASTPDASTAAARASSPHPLASTMATAASTSSKGKQKRVTASPTPSEVELASLRREIPQ